MLVGRERECERLDALLADARLGRAWNLVLRGAPGMGKTALLDYAVQQARGFQVVQVIGVESEADLPYAGLDALLRPLSNLLDALTPGQAHALRVALALERGEEPDRLTVGAATLSLLAEAAESRPLLVVVDDAHWLDGSSTLALTFAARRLAAESIALLFAARESERRAFPGEGLAELQVGPLAAESARLLLRARWGSRLAPAVVQRLASATDGNPLALQELPALLGDDERAGRTPLPDLLPVSDAVEERVRRGLRSLPAETRRALLLVAADELATGLVDRTLLESAEEQGLLRLRDGKATFPHPLYRAGVYHAATTVERRAAHRRLVELFKDEGEADRRAWHLAATSDGPDEAIAVALETAAGHAAERGGRSAQSRALERAAELSPDEDERARRLVAAARAALNAAELERALLLVESALTVVRDPVIRADAIFWRASTTGHLGRSPSMPDLALEAERVAPQSKGAAAKLLEVNLVQLLVTLELDSAEALAQRVGAISERPLARHRLTIAVARGRSAESHELLQELLDSADRTGLPRAVTHLGRFEQARSLALDEIAEHRSRGELFGLALESGNLAEAELRLGRFAEARAAALKASEIAELGPFPNIVGHVATTLAHTSAIQGDEDAARAQVARALEAARGTRDAAVVCDAQRALGMLALTLSRPAEAVEQLRPVAELVAREKIQNPAFLTYAPEMIEAYVLAGDGHAAEAELARFHRQASVLEQSWALAIAARLCGYLAGDAELDHHFGEALRPRDADAASPFERARTQLLYGERLRRARRRIDAREQLRAAVEAFDELGAKPWAERARRELGASGISIPRRDPTAPEKLTPQELQIALHVTEGKTNKEVAAALFLSTKTIEFHLTRVYRKLELHSRGELIRMFTSAAVSEHMAVGEIAAK
jgi:DNA-binding CsgD family transcriptional regulator